MIITFPDYPSYRIGHDDMNFTVETVAVAGKDAKTPGAKTWKAVSFHPNLPQSLRSLAGVILAKDQREISLDSYIAQYEGIANSLKMGLKSAA